MDLRCLRCVQLLLATRQVRIRHILSSSNTVHSIQYTTAAYLVLALAIAESLNEGLKGFGLDHEAACYLDRTTPNETLPR